MKTNTNTLKYEAESIINNLSLLDILNKYGEARVVGSVALNLVVRPDIDIHLFTQRDDLLEVVDEIYHTLLNQKNIKHIRISDYRENGGIKIGIDSYYGPNENWSIDLWITNILESTGFALMDRLKQQLTDEQRKTILKIKEILHSKGKLQDGLSAQIYTAVVDNGIYTFDQFKEMIEK